MAKINFEKALEKLETIVHELEEGEVSLDAALEKYEEGIGLTKECRKQLQEAEKKVEVLLKDAEGEFVTEPFEGSNAEPVAEVRPKPKKKNVKKISDDDLLFS
jgi:exodeoxyribonuclease VII small subunit